MLSRNKPSDRGVNRERSAPSAKAALLASVLGLAALARPAQALLWWRDHLRSRWTDRPLAMDGSDAKWPGNIDISEPQMDLRAVNDGTALYLRLSADGVDGRAVLSGAYRQDLIVWFMKPDGKSEDWGVILPYGSLGSPRSLPRAGEAPILAEVEPLMVLREGLAVSTAALPAGVAVKSALSGRDPVLELAIPLERLRLKGRTALFDVISAPVSPEIERMIRPRQARAGRRSWEESDAPAADSVNGGWSAGTGGRFPGGRRPRGPKTPGSSQPHQASVPEPLDLKLAVKLAERPK